MRDYILKTILPGPQSEYGCEISIFVTASMSRLKLMCCLTHLSVIEDEVFLVSPAMTAASLGHSPWLRERLSTQAFSRTQLTALTVRHSRREAPARKSTPSAPGSSLQFAHLASLVTLPAALPPYAFGVDLRVVALSYASVTRRATNTSQEA